MVCFGGVARVTGRKLTAPSGRGGSREPGVDGAPCPLHPSGCTPSLPSQRCPQALPTWATSVQLHRGGAFTFTIWCLNTPEGDREDPPESAWQPACCWLSFQRCMRWAARAPPDMPMSLPPCVDGVTSPRMPISSSCECYLMQNQLCKLRFQSRALRRGCSVWAPSLCRHKCPHQRRRHEDRSRGKHDEL